jgi:hypothetical protein
MNQTLHENATTDTVWVVCVFKDAQVYTSAPFATLHEAMDAADLVADSWIEPLEITRS